MREERGPPLGPGPLFNNFNQKREKERPLCAEVSLSFLGTPMVHPVLLRYTLVIP